MRARQVRMEEQCGTRHGIQYHLTLPLRLEDRAGARLQQVTVKENICAPTVKTRARALAALATPLSRHGQQFLHIDAGGVRWSNQIVMTVSPHDLATRRSSHPTGDELHREDLAGNEEWCMA